MLSVLWPTIFDRQGARALALQDGPQGGGERELAALRILGLARLQAQPAALEVHVGPLPRQELRLHAPAGEVGDREHGLEVVGELRQHGVALLALEEAGARIVLLQEIDEGAADNPAGALPEPEHAFERRELAVDGGVGRLLLLPVPDIGEHPIRRDSLRPPSGEEPFQVVDRGLGPAEGLAGIGAVLVDQQGGEVVETRLVGIGHVRALTDLRLPVLELLTRPGPRGGAGRSLQGLAAHAELHHPGSTYLELAGLPVAVSLLEERTRATLSH